MSVHPEPIEFAERVAGHSFAPARGYGALVDSLLDDAFAVLQHDTGEHDPEWHHQREWLAKRFQKTLRKKRHNEKLCRPADSEAGQRKEQPK